MNSVEENCSETHHTQNNKKASHTKQQKGRHTAKAKLGVKMQNHDGNMAAMDPMAIAAVRAREAQYQVSAKMWEASVKINCGKNNFKLIQFIVDDDVEMFGSDWQRLVCKQINIPEQYAERFWQERGKRVARMAINRRRHNTAIAMKKRFKGKTYRN